MTVLEAESLKAESHSNIPQTTLSVRAADADEDSASFDLSSLNKSLNDSLPSFSDEYSTAANQISGNMSHSRFLLNSTIFFHFIHV